MTSTALSVGEKWKKDRQIFTTLLQKNQICDKMMVWCLIHKIDIGDDYIERCTVQMSELRRRTCF
jgi:hypothetical protein